MSTENKLSQKEYLKRYLSNDKDEKKKKKKRKIVSSSAALKRSQIIDDDIDLKNMRVLGDDEIELYQLDEDAPQIAGIVDERPPEVQAMEYYGNKKRWKVFGADSGDGDELMIKDSFDNSKEVLRKDKSSILSDLNSSKLVREQSVNHKNGDSDLELPRKQRKHENKAVNSSFRESNKETLSNLKSRHSGSDSDLSPPRYSVNKNKQKTRSNRSDDSDLSPPRANSDKRKYRNDSDLSPPRRSDKSSVRKYEKPTSGSDSSLPRKKKSSAVRNYRKNSDSDLSPPRRSDKFIKKKSGGKSDSDLSPPRRSDKHERRSRHFKDSDFSPPQKDRAHLNSRKHENGSDSDLSPPRRNQKSEKSIDSRRRDTGKYNLHERDYDRYNKNSKEPSKISYYNKDRRKHENDGNSSDNDRRGDPNKKFQSSKGKERPDLYNAGILANSKDSKGDKMTKTLEGKRAGLQNAKQLKRELSEFKEREDQLFSKLSSDLSGRGAAAVMRDRKTGRKRDLEKERSDALEKAEKSAEQNEKYSKWGRGLKQVEDAAERAASALHEMSKPLARYADDDDLDKILKAQEREGDPMLDYIRQKQNEAIPLTESKPVYKGSFLPNRFGIRPGYRWDGVDRSNGYEKQWFTTQNNRKARDEEAYKWSTSDM